MDRHSILDLSSASPAVELDMLSQSPSPSRSLPPSVSAGIAAANAHLPQSARPVPRFPGEDYGHSLVEMAARDLDAALQLLAERAQYITGASGAAIALRRGEHSDMLCRASTGSNAPELGALLSMDYGLSGASVRTRQAQRCDDAERDSRVNREGCRQLGIASVVVMPIVSDDQVLGVFELFSGEPHAFNERDLFVLQRLSEMVETAIRHAVAAQAMATAQNFPQAPAATDVQLPPEPQSDAHVEIDERPLQKPAQQNSDEEPQILSAPRVPDPQILPEAKTLPELQPLSLQAPAAAKPQPAALYSETQSAAAESSSPVISADLAPAPAEKVLPAQEVATGQIAENRIAEKPESQEKEPAPPAKKPLFWSVATHSQPDSGRAAEPSELLVVPRVLRNLHKCQACGFPVSQGRTFCVECEEKQWRGQRPVPAPTRTAPQPQPQPQLARSPEDAPKIAVARDFAAAASSGQTKEPATAQVEIHASAASAAAQILTSASAPIAAAPPASLVSSEEVSADLPQNDSARPPAFDSSAPFLSSALESESWLSANKYILGVLLVVAIVIAAVVWLR